MLQSDTRRPAHKHTAKGYAYQKAHDYAGLLGQTKTLGDFLITTRVPRVKTLPKFTLASYNARTDNLYISRES